MGLLIFMSYGFVFMIGLLVGTYIMYEPEEKCMYERAKASRENFKNSDNFTYDCLKDDPWYDENSPWFNEHIPKIN